MTASCLYCSLDGGYSRDCASALRGSCADPFGSVTGRSALPHSVSSGARVLVILFIDGGQVCIYFRAWYIH